MAGGEALCALSLSLSRPIRIRRTAWADAKPFERRPDVLQRIAGVKLERAWLDPFERPTTTLQLALSGNGCIVPVGPVPALAVALDGERSLPAPHHKVDAVAEDLVLRSHPVTAPAMRRNTSSSNQISNGHGWFPIPAGPGRPSLQAPRCRGLSP